MHRLRCALLLFLASRRASCHMVSSLSCHVNVLHAGFATSKDILQSFMSARVFVTDVYKCTDPENARR